MTSRTENSPHSPLMSCGLPTSPKTVRTRASCTCARSGRVVQQGSRLHNRLPIEGLVGVSTLNKAGRRKGSLGAVANLDRDTQFGPRKFVHALSDNGSRGSMGCVGAFSDNAGTEPFFALLQKNILNRQQWSTREQLWLVIATWIERTYYRKRRQRHSANSPYRISHNQPDRTRGLNHSNPTAN